MNSIEIWTLFKDNSLLQTILDIMIGKEIRQHDIACCMVFQY